MKIALTIGFSYLVQEPMFREKIEKLEQWLAFQQVEWGPPGS